MKTKEFIGQVENLYLKVLIDLDSIKILRDFREMPIATVSKNRQNEMNTKFKKFNLLDIESQNKLFNLLVEYASTPIEERKEEKKYYLKLKRFSNIGRIYVNYCVKEERWVMSTKFENGSYQTKFTLAELPDWVHEMLEQGHLVKEEVE